MEQNSKTELGTIKIHKNVIATIVASSIEDIPGVIRVGENLKTTLLRLFGNKSGASAAKIEFDNNNEATITIPLVVKFGYNIPEVASQVQDSVKLAAENATNIIIKEINVKIQQIERGTE